MSLRTKLGTIFLLPLVVLAVFTVLHGSKNWQRYQSAREAGYVLSLAIEASDLMLELQRERGLGAAYVNSQRRQFSDELKTQRRVTDDHIEQFYVRLKTISQSELGTTLSDRWNTVDPHLKNLDKVRNSIDDNTAQGHYQVYFNALVERILTFFEGIHPDSGDSEFGILSADFRTLLRLQEFAGQERALMSAFTASNKTKMSPSASHEISQLIGLQTILEDRLLLSPREATREDMKALLNQPASREVKHIRSTSLTGQERTSLLNEIHAQIGYGGLVHNFKNYVLRRDERFHKSFETKFTTLLSLLETYRLLPNITAQELRALSKIEQTFRLYRSNLSKVAAFDKAGPTVNLDKLVQVDDQAAIEALARLGPQEAQIGVTEWLKRSTRRIDEISSIASILREEMVHIEDGLIAEAKWSFIVLTGIAILSVFVSILLGTLMTNRFVKGIANMQDTLHQSITQGDFSSRVHYEGNDEIGAIALAVNNHLEMLADLFSGIVTTVQAASTGGFDTRLEGTFKGEVRTLQSAVNNSVITLQSATEENERAMEAVKVAQADAEKANLSKSEFLANISHEIRTPMNGILGMLDLITNDTLTDKQTERIKIAHNSADLLLILINDLLDLSQLEANKMQLTSAQFDARQSTFEVCGLMRQTAQDKGLVLDFEVTGSDKFMMEGDETRLRQIMLNLISNAIKFTPEGSVHVYLSQTTFPHGDSEFTFSVTDSGIGIADEDKERLFQRFERADQSITRKFEGTGLGLAISNQLVHLMGGKLILDSKPGKGSTFRFTLPTGISRTLRIVGDGPHAS